MGSCTEETISAKKNSRINTEDKTLLDLKHQIRKIKDYIQNLNWKIQEAKKSAIIALRNQDKRKALFAMKLKRLYESTLERNYGAAIMVEQSEMNLKGAMQDSQLIQVMKDANKITSELQSKVSLSEFEQLYEDLNKNQEKNKKIQQFFNEVNVEDADIIQEFNSLGNGPISEQKVINTIQKLEEKKPAQFYQPQRISNPIPNKPEYSDANYYDQRIPVPV